jgi:hypothetical protein
MAEPQSRQLRGHLEDANGAAVLPRCSTETLQTCRKATVARLRAGGALPGCPLVPPLPAGQVDDVLDFVDDVVRSLPTWSPAAWTLLARTFSLRTGAWTLGRARAAHCTAVTGRQELLRHAQERLDLAMPATADPEVREALSGALVGVLLADVLPMEDYAALTRPLAATGAAAAAQSPV